MERFALLIACDEYEDPGLRALRAPASDARDLAEVLSDPAVGGFEVETLVNRPMGEVARAVERFFGKRRPDDLSLVHLACHGVKDEAGGLYFAMADTDLELRASTGLSADFVNQTMHRSPSTKIVLMLDCCFAGKFADGLKPRANDDVHGEEKLDGRGRVVITASTATEYSFEGDTLSDTGQPGVSSVFTGALVRGLRSGEVGDHPAGVTLDELYGFLYDEVRRATPNQKPAKWAWDLRGDLIIAKRPRQEVADLPEQVRRELGVRRLNLKESPDGTPLAPTLYVGDRLLAWGRDALESARAAGARLDAAYGEPRRVLGHLTELLPERLVLPAGDAVPLVLEAGCPGLRLDHVGVASGPVKLPTPVSWQGPRPARRHDSEIRDRRPTVAVLDTGIDEHPWLSDVVHRWPAFGGVGIGLEPEPGQRARQRGTFSAGLVLQGCPDADLLDVIVGRHDGVVVESDLVRALVLLARAQTAALQGEPGGLLTDVVLLPSGYYPERVLDPLDPHPLADALVLLGQLGMVTIAPAGDAGSERGCVPALFGFDRSGAAPYDRIPLLTVAATDPLTGRLCDFSNRGPWVSGFVPGLGVVSTTPAVRSDPDLGADPRLIVNPDDFRAGFGTWSGTSFAAASLAGQVARVLAEHPARHAAPDLVERGKRALERVVGL